MCQPHIVALVNQQFVFKLGERALETLVIIDGRLTLVNADGTEEPAMVGTVIDDRVMLLPPETILLRSTDAIAPVECSVAALSSEDLIRLRQQRIEIDRHVR